MKQEKILHSIFDYLTSIDYEKIHENGFLPGKAGLALFFYSFDQSYSFQKARDLGGKLIDDLWTPYLLKESPYFERGLGGIAWVLDWLRERSILNVGLNSEDILKKIDSLIIHLKFPSPIQVDVESGLFSSGLYLYKRYVYYNKCTSISDDKEVLLYKYFLREFLIHYIEEVERILYKTSFLYNICLPQMSLRTLNSIIFFLLSVQKDKIYPLKTKKLLEYSFLLAIPYLKEGSLTDRIVLNTLIKKLKEHIDIHEEVIVDKSFSGNKNKIIEELSLAGFYTLLYNNSQIFSEVYAILLKIYPNLMELLQQRMLKDKISPYMDGLAAIGYGLLTINKR